MLETIFKLVLYSDLRLLGWDPSPDFPPTHLMWVSVLHPRHRSPHMVPTHPGLVTSSLFGSDIWRDHSSLLHPLPQVNWEVNKSVVGCGGLEGDWV